MPGQNRAIEWTFGYLPEAGEEAIQDGWRYLENHPSSNIKSKLEHAQATIARIAQWRLPLGPALAFIVAQIQSEAGRASWEKLSQMDERVHYLAREFLEMERPPNKHIVDEGIRRANRFSHLRKLFYTAYTDPELALLALASHLTRMNKIKAAGYSESRPLCEDNEVIFLPLMEMFGLWEVRREYAEISLEKLNPHKIYDKIKSAKEAIYPRLHQYHEEIRSILAPGLEKAGIAAEIKLHLSMNSSIYRRLRRGEALNEVVRQLKIDLTVDTEEDCYQVLRLLHKNWHPLYLRTLAGGYFRDLIASPKFNGYQALITTAGYKLSQKQDSHLPVEFRIFTREMEKINAMGFIASQYYSSPPVRIKNAWWEDDNLLEFVRAHPLNDNTSTEIFVFSPVGKIYRRLKPDSTPIDYAYRIHSDVGDHCKRIWVNGEESSYKQKLRVGDLVEIEVDPDYNGPDKSWLASVKTTTAQSHISRALRKQAPHKGRQSIDKILKRELESYNMSGEISETEIQEMIEQFARKSGYTDVTGLYIDIATPRKPDEASEHLQMEPSRIVAWLIAQKLAPQIARTDGQPLGVPLNRVSFARCSDGEHQIRVSAGSDIVGRMLRSSTKYQRLVVYREGCPNAPTGEQAIALEWFGDRRPGEPVKLRIAAVDRPHLLETILQRIYKLYDQGVYLLAVEASVSLEREAVINCTVEAPDHRSVELLSNEMDDLKATGAIDECHLAALNPIEKLRLREANRLPNPYTMGPVHERRVFKGREAEINLILSSLKGEQNVVVLYGPNRVGKTSLLQYIQAHLAEEYAFLPVMVDMQGIAEHSENSLWLEIVNRVNESLERLHHGRKARPRAYFKRFRGDIFKGFQAWLTEIKTTLSAHKLLIMIDEFNLLDEVWKDTQEALGAVYRMKAIVENNRDICFVFCVQEALYRQSQSTPRQSISWPLLRSGAPIRLDYIDRAAAEKLIRDPLGQMLHYDDAVVEQIIQLTACHPYYLHHILHRIINSVCLEQRKVITMDDLHCVLPDIMANGEHIFQNLRQECCWGFREPVVKNLALLSGIDCSPVAARSIYTQIKRLGRRNVTRQDIDYCLNSLCEIGIVKKQGDSEETSYTIRIPLFNQWLLHDRLMV